MACKDCTPCLETFKDTCVRYTGESFPDLGVENGDDLSHVLEKILEKLSSLEPEQDCKDCE